ncbi:PilN domain-containing protein [Solibacillus sp. FSL H8-0538]|uniref:PilN domain-containing protein n=1 Tax=Solibacillus sp. FSL H8-0538 TaxID=2921400 RepID=UPI0030F666BE
MIPDINLLPNIEKGQSSSKLLYGVVGIIALLLLSLLVWQYFGARSELVTLTNEEQALQAQRDQVQSEYDELISGNKGSLEESVAFVERVSYPVSPLIDETQNLLPENTYLRNYSFDEKSATISVDFETLSDVSTYVSRLENSAYFVDIQLGSVSNFDVNPITEDTAEEINFNEVPRYSVELTLFMNETYLASGGVQ